MTKTEALIHQHTFGVNPYQDQLIEEVRSQNERISELEEMLLKECQHSADQKLRADQMSQQHSTQAALNSEARKELAEMKIAQAVQPAAPDDIDLPDVEDMAHSAVQEALSYGVNHDVFHRWMRAVMDKTVAAISAAPAHPAEGVPAPGKNFLTTEQLSTDMLFAAKVWRTVPLQATPEMIEAWAQSTELPQGMKERSDDEVNAYAANRDWQAMLNAAESTPVILDEIGMFESWADENGFSIQTCNRLGYESRYTRDALSAWNARAALASTQPAAQGLDAEMLNFINDKRVALTPEYEGPWKAEVFGDEAEPVITTEGNTVRDAVSAALAAQAKQGGA